MRKTTFVIGILVIITAILYKFALSKPEHFTNSKIEILDSFTFPRDYLETFNSSDYTARRIVEPKKTIVTYQNSIKRLNQSERNIVRDIVSAIPENEFTNNQFIWKLAFFDGIESNFPHTHNDTILFPKCKLENTKYNQETFLHEAIHVCQKKNPEVFARLYAMWGFKRAPEFKMTDIGFDCRANPDTPNMDWAFQGRYIFLVKYDEIPQSLSDVSYVAYDLEKKETIKLEETPGFTEMFGESGNVNFYHPDEISATMIAEFIINSAYQNTRATQLLEQWYGSL